MPETKAERFARVAEKRTNDVLTALHKLGKCADRRMYEYTERQTDQILAAIVEETDRLKALFSSPVGRERFVLSDAAPEPRPSNSSEEQLGDSSAE